MAYAEHALLLPPHAFFLLTLMDGTRTADDMRRAFADQFDGVELPVQQIHDLIAGLDKGCYLDTASSRARQVEVDRAYRAAPVRPAWHAGQAYPESPDELVRQLEAFYDDDQGAGRPQPKAGGSGDDPWAVLVPHIDLRVGGPCFTHGYRPLLEAEPADLYVVLGVAHYGDGSFFVATGKDFDTPLGRVETDRGVLEAWSERAACDLISGEIAHRTEHSVEFQLLFMQHGLGARAYKMLPILCGPLEPYLQVNRPPGQVEESARLLDGLREVLAGDARRVRYIVSVDLAHVGPKFGDPEPIDDDEATRHEELDRNLLSAAEQGDADALFATLAGDGNARRVDAASALYTLLYLQPGLRGRIAAYGQNRQPDTGSMVTFASMVFTPA
jgi:AmmeMemoRadiSam system protein B